MNITFDSPPINEVVMGVRFLPREDFLVPYFGSFWEQVKEQFPKPAHAPVYVEGNESPQTDEGYVLPRVWLQSEDGATLLQLQQNCFLFNWREVTGLDQGYIRYSQIRAEFLRLWKLFSSFVEQQTGQPLVPTSFELSYVNFIPCVNGQDTFDLAKKVFRSFAVPFDASHVGRRGFQLQYNESLDGEAGDLTVIYGSGIRPDKVQGVKFDLSVRKKQVSESSFDDWVELAHSTILVAFKELTTSEMHVAWKMREG
ncbi:TIGR04255 family protein [Ralstonia sp.]|uniref:TIGR04255 family protein n=1 Tax=Ralstonia sp. TaxID=54061 RepID=UPI0031DB7D06